MNVADLYAHLKASVSSLRLRHDTISELPDQLDLDMPVSRAGLDSFTLGEFVRDLEQRLGQQMNFEDFVVKESFDTITVGMLIDFIQSKTPRSPRNPVVVYVDDEEENLFVFRRKFGKDFTLRTFQDPHEALLYIKVTAEVGLVITDEVMPGLRGNQLCDEVKKVKPFMQFILITGNPENDNDLMYTSLRRNRFYEFIQKPVDFDGRREEYIGIIRSILSGETQ
jgi:CheY-like chemotaxis protein/acyl carrier protein